jgi:hypothetical protein
MPTINKWTGVGVDVQTALATALNVTAISKASEAVVTVTNTYANGDYVLFIVSGMNQMNYRVVRVKTVSGTSFTCEGVNSTAFDTFSSGAVQKITFGASASTFVDVNMSGGEADAIDVTTVHDTVKKEIPGAKSAVSVAITSLWDPTDTALIELKNADDSGAIRCVQLRFTSGARVLFAAYPSAPLLPTGSTGDKVQTPVSFKLSGPAQAYAT